jgi:hypothetical protein
MIEAYNAFLFEATIIVWLVNELYPFLFKILLQLLPSCLLFFF